MYFLWCVFALNVFSSCQYLISRSSRPRRPYNYSSKMSQESIDEQGSLLSVPQLRRENERRAKAWCFTINNPDRSTLATLFESSADIISYAIWSLEEGENGTPHIQGYIKFTSKYVFNTVKRVVGVRAHVETSHGSEEANYEYISHTGKHANKPGLLDGPWTIGSRNNHGKRNDLSLLREAVKGIRKFDELYDRDDIAMVLARHTQYAQKLYTLERNKRMEKITFPELYCWQYGILFYLNQPWKTREIFWIWSSLSGTGKSSFGQYVSTRYDTLIAEGEYKDILYAYSDQDVIWFDISRTEQLSSNLLATLEKLSNGGLQMSTKYQSCQKHVYAKILVTSNRAPPRDLLPNRITSIEAATCVCENKEPHVHGIDEVETLGVLLGEPDYLE